MYFKLFSLIIVSLLISFGLVFNFKKIILSPEIDLKNILYKSYPKITIDLEVYTLDYEVDIDNTSIKVYVFGLYESFYFDEAFQAIYKVIQKKKSKKPITIYILNHKNEILLEKYFK